MEVNIPEIDTEAIYRMKLFGWPGNIRQLQNTIQRFLLSGYSKVGPDEIEESIGTGIAQVNGEGETGNLFENFDKVIVLKDMEKEFRLKYFKFVRAKTSSDADAARQLGLAPPNYYRMCKELGLK